MASLMSSAMGTSVDWGKVRELTSDVTGEIPARARQLWDSVEATQKVLTLSHRVCTHQQPGLYVG